MNLINIMYARTKGSVAAAPTAKHKLVRKVFPRVFAAVRGNLEEKAKKEHGRKGTRGRTTTGLRGSAGKFRGKSQKGAWPEGHERENHMVEGLNTAEHHSTTQSSVRKRGERGKKKGRGEEKEEGRKRRGEGKGGRKREGSGPNGSGIEKGEGFRGLHVRGAERRRYQGRVLETPRSSHRLPLFKAIQHHYKPPPTQPPSIHEFRFFAHLLLEKYFLSPKFSSTSGDHLERVHCIGAGLCFFQQPLCYTSLPSASTYFSLYLSLLHPIISPLQSLPSLSPSPIHFSSRRS
jgi:hypothetical protein